MTDQLDVRRQATDPLASAWVQANAGTGKTTLLMRRLLALLLNGADPNRILCATFTRAAAREIVNRVSEKLYAWSVAPQEKLQAELESLFHPSPSQLANYLSQAPFLFADVEEKLQVQTLHQFCDHLLRNFPLEAGLLPNFNVLSTEEEGEERLAFFNRQLPTLLEKLKQFDYYQAAQKILSQKDFFLWLEKFASAVPKVKQKPATNQLERWLNQEFAAYKRKQNWINHDQQIYKALELLANSPKIVQLLQREKQLDHILLDETQDMDQNQWQVINKISEDFFSSNLEEVTKTIFAVGDVKQTVYRWRGANPKLFVHFGQEYQDKAVAVSKSFHSLMIAGSFRSGPRVLKFVDQLFSLLPQHLQTQDYFANLQHSSRALHQKDLVKVWLTTRDQDQPPSVAELRKQIASKVAAEIAELLASKTLLACRQNRLIRAGDIMIVLRKRTDNLHLDIADLLKDYQIPVAEPDRINLNDNLVIKDLLALAKLVLLPEDDFNLAVVLKGPLFAFSDQQLLQIRKAQQVHQLAFWNLFQQQKTDLGPDLSFPVAKELSKLRDHYLNCGSALDFLNKLLVSYRDVFPACQEIEALLNYCSQFEKKRSSSLAAFIRHFEQAPREVKRDFDQEEDKVRMTTVHSAKGLQAPVVFFVSVTADAGRDAKEEDYASILYVALTRAEEQLYVFVDEKKSASGSWLKLVRATCQKFLTDQDLEQPVTKDGFWQLGSSQFLVEEQEQAKSLPSSPPKWLISQPRVESLALKPSTTFRPWFKLGQLKSAQLGTVIHQLLEILPTVPEAEWDEVASSFLGANLSSLTAEQRAFWQRQVITSLQKLKRDHRFSCLFTETSMAEINLIDNQQLFKIDRCCLEADRCVIVDYKTDRKIPNQVDEIPSQYLKQLWNYSLVVPTQLPKLFALVWLRQQKIMVLEEKWLSNAIKERENEPATK